MLDYAVFILTHGRANKVITYDTLRKHGYTGPIYVVVDDLDSELDLYRDQYKDQCLVFSKADIASRFDCGDNFRNNAAIFYARNACFDLAESVGVKYFIEMDDDYGHCGRGKLFFTIPLVALSQKTTQKNSGGMTETYLDSGTYIKSFYSVMYNPSCVKIAMMGDKHRRIHHNVLWNNAVVKIIKDTAKKPL